MDYKTEGFLIPVIIIYIVSLLSGLLLGLISTEYYIFFHSFVFSVLLLFILPDKRKFDILIFLAIFVFGLKEHFFKFFFVGDFDDIFIYNAISFWGFGSGGIVSLIIYLLIKGNMFLKNRDSN